VPISLWSTVGPAPRAVLIPKSLYLYFKSQTVQVFDLALDGLATAVTAAPHTVIVTVLIVPIVVFEGLGQVCQSLISGNQFACHSMLSSVYVCIVLLFLGHVNQFDVFDLLFWYNNSTEGFLVSFSHTFEVKGHNAALACDQNVFHSSLLCTVLVLYDYLPVLSTGLGCVANVQRLLDASAL